MAEIVDFPAVTNYIITISTNETKTIILIEESQCGSN